MNTSESHVLPTLMTKGDVATSLRRSLSGVDQLRVRDCSFPKPIRQGDPRRGRIYFIREEIEAYLRSKMEQREVAA